MRIIRLTCLLITIFSGEKLFAQTNILTQNQALINCLAKFETVYVVDSDYIKYQTKKMINCYGFGVANRHTGAIIYKAQDDVSYFIKAYGKYITKLDSVAKITRADGKDIYDLPTDDGKGKTQKTFNSKKQLTKIIFTHGDYKFEKRFVYNNLGKIIETTEMYNNKIANKTFYKYIIKLNRRSGSDKLIS